MPLPDPWSGALDAEAREALAHTESRVAARERSGARIYPPAELRYLALELVAPDKARVVIIGQDPYHGAGQAMGLSFSVPRDVRVPPSLRNVFKELKNDLGLEPPEHGDLTTWADQGVLLLNTSLSVEEGRADSHSGMGWERITDLLISHVSARAGPAVFMLWGRHAQAKAPLVDTSRHLVLQAAHPSPLSVRRFLGCRHFSQANAFLVDHGSPPVQWARTSG